MKKLVSVFSLVLLLGIVPASGFGDVLIRADIPFDFTIKNQTYPAGNYSITRPEPANHFFVLQNGERRAEALVVIRSVLDKTRYWNYGDKPAKLVFNKYGAQHFLSQVWMVGETTGYELPKSNAEREVAKNTAESDEVYLAATIVPALP